MADLTRFSLDEINAPLESPGEQLRNAMAQAGITPPGAICFDGKIHRFSTGDKKNKSGWYIAYDDGPGTIQAGAFGDWRTGVEYTWRAEIGRQLTPDERAAYQRRMHAIKEARRADDEMRRANAATSALRIWDSAPEASPEHPYLKRKKIGSHGAKTAPDGRLIVPLYNEHGQISSIQYIAADGQKRYLAGGATGGKFNIIGHSNEPGPVYIAEGFATAATIHEKTGRPCAAAYSASNLVPVTGHIRKLYSGCEIVIVADNDKSGVGQNYANQASAKHGARVVVMPIEGDANDYVNAGLDLTALLTPMAFDDWSVDADEFSGQPAPIKWLIKHWLQQNALMMCFGASGHGKTFVVLDWCLTLAAGFEQWNGKKTKPCNVFYMTSEGRHGLRGRIAAWKHARGVDKLNMRITQSACDINQPDGYQMASQHIRALNYNPGLIVIDTMHGFMFGDENSAADARTMINNCQSLISEFNCAVLIVHHTGIGENAKRRARGSSAFKGAMDIEILVDRNDETGDIAVTQTKSKDFEIAKPFHATLESVAIPGWFDDENEPVKSAVLSIIDECNLEENGENESIDNRQKMKRHKFRRDFETAFIESGCQIYSNAPYVSRQALIKFLTDSGMAKKTAANHVAPGANGKMIHTLIECGYLEPTMNGWVVIKEHHKSALILTSEILKKAGVKKC